MLQAKFQDHRTSGGHIQVYSPGAGADNPLGSNVFH